MPRATSPRITRALALLFALAWSVAAWPVVASAADAGEGASGAPAGHRLEVATGPAPPAGFDDLLRPDSGPAAAAPARPDLSDLAARPGAERNPSPLWQRLAALLPYERYDARIEVELGTDAPATAREAAAAIATDWSEGAWDAAIAGLRTLEESGVGAALGIAWAPGSRPALASGGGDVRIGGTHTNGSSPSIDYDPATGNLFSVVAWGGSPGSGTWTVNMSTDGGTTWSETYTYAAGSSDWLLDVSAAAAGQYLYIGYVLNSLPGEGRMRRVKLSDGISDGTYFYKLIVNAAPASLEQVVVRSNSEDFNNRVYMLVLQSDEKVRFFWDVASDGATFTEESPPAHTPAASALDASWGNHYPTTPGYFLLVTYLGTDGNVRLLRHAAGVWNDVALGNGANVTRPTSVSSYGSTIICAFEYPLGTGVGIFYRISYDNGDTWANGYLATPDGAPATGYQSPRVDARDGHGTAITYSAEVGEPDIAYYQFRAGYAPGVWVAPMPYNDRDVTTGTELALAHLPVPAPGSFSHGAIYFSGSVPYFDLPGLGVVSAPPGALAPRTLALDFAGPNPARAGTRLELALPQAGEVSVSVHDVRGALVRVLADGRFAAGRHPLSWDGTGDDGAIASPGVYFVHARSAGGTVGLRMVLLR